MSLEPMARGSVLRSFRDSARERWGELGIAGIAERLGDECRAVTVEAAAIVARRMPERPLLAASIRRVLSHARGGENATADHSLEHDALVMLFRW